MEVAGDGFSFICNAAVDAFGRVCTALLCAGVAGDGLTALVWIGVPGEGFAILCVPAVGCAGIGVAGDGFLWAPGFAPVPEGVEFEGADFPAAGGLTRGASFGGTGTLLGAVLRGW
jgi:hypothetical protein